MKWLRPRVNIFSWTGRVFFLCRKLQPSSKRRRLTFAICCWSSACTGSRWDLCGPSFQTTSKPSSPCVDLPDGRAPARRLLETRRRPRESPASGFVPAQTHCSGSDADSLASLDGPAPRRGPLRNQPCKAQSSRRQRTPRYVMVGGPADFFAARLARLGGPRKALKADSLAQRRRGKRGNRSGAFWITGAGAASTVGGFHVRRFCPPGARHRSGAPR